MASIRQVRNGKFELCVSHPSLPKGRKYFTFDDRAEAERYGRQWDARITAGLAPPVELLEPVKETRTLGYVLRAWANSGKAAPTEHPTISALISEVGAKKLSTLDYAWCEQWVDGMKPTLAAGTIKKRVGTLSRALDAHLRVVSGSNPLKLLPAGYAGPSADPRDRRLAIGEHERILAVLRGWKRPDRERAWGVDLDLEVLYQTIVLTGMRLREAYRLKVDQVDLEQRVLHVQKSKLWRGKVAFKDVPIRPELLLVLRSYLGKGPLVFPFWDGTPEDLEACSARLSARFRTLFEYAGCDGLREHDLRHEATCQWLELRGPHGWLFRIEEINRIMGWTPGSKMAERYASFRGSDLANRLYGS